jgi:hypothetical protein
VAIGGVVELGAVADTAATVAGTAAARYDCGTYLAGNGGGARCATDVVSVGTGLSGVAAEEAGELGFSVALNGVSALGALASYLYPDDADADEDINCSS